jgi:hypothetical protein
MKGQTDIISVVVIFVISLGLVSTAYLWGIPLIEKRQDTALVDRVGTSFDKYNDNSLERKIEYIANNGGAYTFVADTNGIWYFNSSENSLSFSFTAKASKIATNTTTPGPIPIGWVALSSGNTNVNGTLGIDDSFIVYARSDLANSGLYNITYKVQFRTLWDSTQTNGFKIVLNENGSPYALGKYAQISRGSVATDPSNKNLINTQIQILLG